MDKSNHTDRRTERWDRSYIIDIDDISKRHLRFFLENELIYYNKLVDGMMTKMRAFPEELLSMKGAHEKLWSAAAFSNADLRKLLDIDIRKWPSAMQSTALFMPLKNNKLVVNNIQLMLYDMLADGGKIHPHMRRGMAAELISTAISHAETIVQAQKTATGIMRAPIQLLQQTDLNDKRHVQLTRDLVSLKWNAEHGQTEITIPYTDKPLIVKDRNITDEKFTIMIIRQQPNKGEVIWQVTLLNTPHRYLLELRDQSLIQRKKKAA